jgi:hypothetical protein
VISAELERKILHGLALEWENALCILHPKNRILMKMPSFSLKEMKRRVGYWSGEKREICINRDFAVSSSWNSVKNILLHEMAHQLAEEVFGAVNETPHGPSFKKACRILRADERASERLDEDRGFIHNENDPDVKILRRVKKLFSLARSNNRNEAESAMKKAHELVSKYNIDILLKNADRSFSSIFAGTPALRHPREEYHLASLLGNFYFVRTIWIPAYVINKEKMGRVLELSGTEENVSIASYVYDFIRRYIENRWLEYDKKGLLNRCRKTDFATGIIKGFGIKLREDSADKGIIDRALVVSRDPELDEYMKHRYPHTASISTKAAQCDECVFRDGIKEGKNLVISKGITKSSSDQKYLIDK